MCSPLSSDDGGEGTFEEWGTPTGRTEGVDWVGVFAPAEDEIEFRALSIISLVVVVRSLTSAGFNPVV